MNVGEENNTREYYFGGTYNTTDVTYDKIIHYNGHTGPQRATYIRT